MLRVHISVLSVLLTATAAFAGTTLGVDGTRFTINGRPTFLLGISYYAGLEAPDQFVDRDLARMREIGFNWIRVWAVWQSRGSNASAVDAEGNAREPYLSRLKTIVAKCDRAGIIVDVTLACQTAAADTAGGDRQGYLATFEAHRRAVETILSALRQHDNWYLDLANERNVQDRRFVGFDRLSKLSEVVRQSVPRRLFTASQGDDIDLKDLREYVLNLRVDFITPHRPREAGSPAQTESKTREYLSRMQELGRVVPVHYQEPFRRGWGTWQPVAEDYLTDLQGSRRGGAAGWCLHNGNQRGRSGERRQRSFGLREKTMFEQLDDEENKAIDLLRSKIIATRPS
jgi:hypothetical protein